MPTKPPLPFAALERCVEDWEEDSSEYLLQSQRNESEVIGRQARAELDAFRRLVEAVDRARRETASDPTNVWCRNATTILNAAFVACQPEGNDAEA